MISIALTSEIFKIRDVAPILLHIHRLSLFVVAAGRLTTVLFINGIFNKGMK
jgi:hypothetical protein